MKEIKAFIRREKLDAVVHALRSLGVDAISITRVEGVGRLSDPSSSHLSMDYVTDCSELYKLEVVCRKNEADAIALTIKEQAHTGDHGDGVVYVTRVESALKIRSGNRDYQAIWALNPPASAAPPKGDDESSD